jgi:aspartyl-tRNA synthetase
MGELLNGMKRSHMCGVLRTSDIGQKVTLMGWVQRKRNLGGLIFVDLRDKTGMVQIVFDTKLSQEAFDKAEGLRGEFVIALTGEITQRESVNDQMPTGQIEVFADSLKILNESEVPPIHINDDDKANETLRLKYRYLDLRKPKMQSKLYFRSKLAKTARNFLDDNGFTDVETPVLTKPTPEGARDYLVPSRVNPGKFYALPQSPQLFKQILMVSGFDRYYQIVRCFRDEDLRADRQPEFTQIDIEMSFVEQEDVIAINEQLIHKMFKDALGVEVELPLLQMPYQEAMDRYGVDKPDIRFGLELVALNDLVKECGFKVFTDAIAANGDVRGINIKGASEKISRKDLDKLQDHVKTYGAKGLAWIRINEGEIASPIAKFFSDDEMKALVDRMGGEVGDVLVFVADKSNVVYDALGNLRNELAKKLELTTEGDYKLLWVTEFPLLEYDEEAQRFSAKHHPFTSPMDEDLHLLDTDPGKVRAKAYDIVLNGVEIGGGSIRIHTADLQRKMFTALGFTEEQAYAKFGFLLDAFKYGTPPHGGIAYGLDRLVMLMTGTENIREVIAFPKTQNATCLMTEAPTVVEANQLVELAISVIEKEAEVSTEE